MSADDLNGYGRPHIVEFFVPPGSLHTGTAMEKRVRARSALFGFPDGPDYTKFS
jgi:hypothetical protein